jgi:hypothetical protein
MRYTPRLSEYPLQELPLAVGHVIRCSAFATGLKWKSLPEAPVSVAWINQSYIDYHTQVGKAESNCDPSRSNAKFLVFAISLLAAEGADDVFPDSYRFSREVTCIRLDDDLSFTSESERIRFALNEPMSVAQPKERNIEVLGFVHLPIFWEGGTHYE